MPDAPLVLGATAPDLTITDSTGERVSLATLWAERPLLLAFLRHYG